jgi:hypothetical protein
MSEGGDDGAGDADDDVGADEADDPGSIPLDELAREITDDPDAGATDAAPGSSPGPDPALGADVDDDAGEVPDDAPDLDAVGDVAAASGDGETDAEDAPLGELADRVRGRESSGGGEGESELFEEVGVGEVDTESVWDALEADAEEASEDGDAGVTGVGVGARAERVARDDPTAARPDYVVPKAEYCQRCEYFSEPPEVACTHADSDIVEMPDSDHFRVRGCPKVDPDGGSEFRG